MRRVHAILGAALLFGGAAAAQDRPAKPLTDSGNGALMFQLGGLLTTTPSVLDGVGVGGRYFMADGTAVRAAVGIRHQSDETDPKNGPNTESSSTDLALEGGLELELFQRGPVYIYWGGVAQLLFGSSEDAAETEEGRLGFAAAGMVGASWFFDESISIGAEYRLGLSYVSRDIEPQGGNDREVTQLVFGTGAVGFHLGFWF
jgi:hypothetical protein